MTPCEAAQAYGIMTMSETIVFDPEGRIISSGLAADDLVNFEDSLPLKKSNHVATLSISFYCLNEAGAHPRPLSGVEGSEQTIVYSQLSTVKIMNKILSSCSPSSPRRA